MHKVLTDASREDSPVVIFFARFVPWLQSLDKEAIALNDSSKKVVEGVFTKLVSASWDKDALKELLVHKRRSWLDLTTQYFRVYARKIN